MSETAPATAPQDHPPRTRSVVRGPQTKPWAAYSILGITVLVCILQLLTADPRLMIANVRCGDLAACLGMKINPLILGGQLWRFITPIFLHGSLLHIGFNMYALYVLGPELERHFGHIPFVFLYLVSGFAGIVLSFLLTANASLGASTAIFGLMGAQGVFVYRNRKLFGRRAQTMLRSIMQIAAINLLIGLTPGIDNWGHLGGLAGGVLFAWIAAPIYTLEDDGYEFRLVNRTKAERVWLATAAVALVFGALAYSKFI